MVELVDILAPFRLLQLNRICALFSNCIFLNFPFSGFYQWRLTWRRKGEVVKNGRKPQFVRFPLTSYCRQNNAADLLQAQVLELTLQTCLCRQEKSKKKRKKKHKKHGRRKKKKAASHSDSDFDWQTQSWRPLSCYFGKFTHHAPAITPEQETCTLVALLLF